MTTVIKRENVSEHKFEDGIETGDDLFEVYQLDDGWFWGYIPHWRDAGPFATEAAAIAAGKAFKDANGRPYIEL